MVASRHQRNRSQSCSDAEKRDKKEKEMSDELDKLRIPGIELRRMQEGVDGTDWRNRDRDEQERESA
ncbi:MAG: hypothetical protein JW941_10745 [Candidatus Coatesbacteria bacterium]|nr:hypothetical protein [Candidatus Coatesbacteria bacterium]